MKQRKLKFRVWTGISMEYKVMAGWLGAFYVQGISETDSASMSYANTKYPETTQVMQFVDRLDKHKRELYEGDIISFNEYNEHGNTGKRIGEIYWDSSECCFAIYSEHSEIGLGTKKGVWLAWAKNIELLGNKFEDPDLQEEY